MPMMCVTTYHSSAPPGPTVYLLDHFTDADGTALTAHTMDTGPGWTTVWATVPSVQGNTARAEAVDSAVIADAGAADGTLTVTLAYATGEAFMGVLVRATDSNNYYRFYYDGAGGWSLNERQTGSNSTPATGSSSLTGGVTYTLSVVCAGATLTLKVNGATVITYASATFNQTATKFGVYGSNYAGAASRFDDFQVTA